VSASASSVFISSLFAALMCAAMWSDATARRLPNRLTVTAVLVGLAVRLTLGSGAVLSGSLGILLGVALCIPLFALGAIGGGDVKLVAAAGAFLGPGELLWALSIAASLGLLLVLEEVTRRKVVLPVLFRSKDLLLYLMTLGRKGERPVSDAPAAITVPYGVAIAAGALAAWFVPSVALLR
jgi:prepilin peptidase CpaA